MSITKQRLFIARNSKSTELEKLLSILKDYVSKEVGCKYFEIYRSDDDENEFLVYEEWSSQEAFNAYQEQGYFKTFKAQSVQSVLKEHFINIA